MKVKICGMFRPVDIEAANLLKPDYIGFVFAKSPRQVSFLQAASLKAGLSPDIQAVGVFVNEEPKHIIALLKQSVIDIAQLHGDEDAAYIQRLREETGKPVWKAIKVTQKADITPHLDSPADLLLLDSGQGSGKPFDWRHIPDIGRPYLLAGGICPDNIAKALSCTHPYGIDVSSGVETEGVKDFDKMRMVIQSIRSLSNNETENDYE